MGQLSRITQIVAHLKNNTLEEITADELFEGAIRGMVGTLHDPYSVYLDQKDFDLLHSEMRGYAGLGIYVGLRQESRLTVVAPIKDTPAFKAGLQAGDIIVKIDDRNIGYEFRCSSFFYAW